MYNLKNSWRNTHDPNSAYELECYQMLWSLLCVPPRSPPSLLHTMLNWGLFILSFCFYKCTLYVSLSFTFWKEKWVPVVFYSSLRLVVTVIYSPLGNSSDALRYTWVINVSQRVFECCTVLVWKSAPGGLFTASLFVALFYPWGQDLVYHPGGQCGD